MAEQLLESLSNRILTLDGLIEEQNAIRMNETENDTFAFVESMKNKNTKSKTTSDLKNFKEWMRNENLNEDRNLEDIPPRELDMYLARFFLTVRKQENEMVENDTFAFVESMKNKNTKSKTTSDLKNFKEWMRNENLNEDRNLEDIPPRELDMYLARFFLTVRKQDKEEYEPDTLKSFQSSFQRYLAEKGYASIILKDDCFKHSREMFSRQSVKH